MSSLAGCDGLGSSLDPLLERLSGRLDHLQLGVGPDAHGPDRGASEDDGGHDQTDRGAVAPWVTTMGVRLIARSCQ